VDERESLAERFEEHRTRLRAVAYRMLGSLSEADDAVQETWLRLSRIDADELENLDGWLTTVVAQAKCPQGVPLPRCRCGAGNGRTIAWTARGDECSSRDRSLVHASGSSDR
jgi:hypothetical protein